MVVWSSICRAVIGAQRASNTIFNKVTLKNGLQLRQMSDHKVFLITASRWQWNKTKDLLHFYIFVGFIPLGLISLYANVFVGPAELAPIPEGYVPKEHEYYRHPITRFFKKYIMESEQAAYERHLHNVWEQYDLCMLRKIEKEVKTLQSARGDYQHWYYIPSTSRDVEKIQEDVYELRHERYQGRMP